MVINSYRALFNDDSIKYCNASSMIKAIEMLKVEFGEPRNILLDKENVLTEIGDITTVNITTECVDDEDLELEDSKIYPSSLSNINRGNTIYFTKIPQEDYEFVKWILPNGDESTDDILMITVTNDESVTSLNIKCVFAHV